MHADAVRTCWSRPYPQADLLREALTVAAAARPEPRELETAAGAEIGERWRAARLAALRRLRGAS
jgi:hypothetical protein